MKVSWDQEKYINAYLFAARVLNRNKLIGTDLPYMVHVSLVSMEVFAALEAEPIFNGDLAMQCALLHDVMEDANVTFNELSTQFGIEVAHGVMSLTKNSELEKSLQMRDSLNRIQKQPKEIWVVKMADRITNLLPPPGQWNTEKVAAYREEANEIYDVLSPASEFLAKRLKTKIVTYARRQ